MTEEEKQLLKNPDSLLPGGGLAWHKFSEPSSEILRTFTNPHIEDDFEVILSSEEFTALCPLTKFPDFYQIEIRYVPNEKCVESKSFKFYIGSFRDYGAFIETLTNRIADDFMEVCNPRSLLVTNTMNARGGVPITVVVERYGTDE